MLCAAKGAEAKGPARRLSRLYSTARLSASELHLPTLLFLLNSIDTEAESLVLILLPALA